MLTSSENGKGVELPNHAELSILDQTVCADAYNSLPESHEARQTVSIVDSVICAARNNTDSCWVRQNILFLLHIFIVFYHICLCLIDSAPFILLRSTFLNNPKQSMIVTRRDRVR